jgi:hypothetical protein
MFLKMKMNSLSTSLFRSNKPNNGVGLQMLGLALSVQVELLLIYWLFLLLLHLLRPISNQAVHNEWLQGHHHHQDHCLHKSLQKSQPEIQYPRHRLHGPGLKEALCELLIIRLLPSPHHSETQPQQPKNPRVRHSTSQMDVKSLWSLYPKMRIDGLPTGTLPLRTQEVFKMQLTITPAEILPFLRLIQMMHFLPMVFTALPLEVVQTLVYLTAIRTVFLIKGEGLHAKAERARIPL